MLQAVLNGSRPADAHPALPVLARHLARDARDVARLGITSVHVHPRDPNLQETLDPMYVGDVVAAIRAEVPGMEIGVTTGRWIEPDPARRVQAVRAWGHLGIGKPDVCSVNVHESGWLEVCKAATSVGIGVELGVWTMGDAVTLRNNGVPPGTTRVLAESTVSDPETATAEAVRIMRALGPIDVPVRIAYGERDWLIRWPRWYERLRRMLPDAEYVKLADCGHLPMWDDPELTARTILEVTRARDADRSPAAAD